jgi:CPA1 family monovalent cation:H+ antiporter
MILDLTSTLALFMLIALSTAVFFFAKRLKVPYTVLLVFVGLLLVPVVNLPYLNSIFGFLGDMALTPELLFYIFLPILIFESSFNINIRRMLESSWSIMLLSTVAVFISAAVIALLLFISMPLIGLQLPFSIALLFGAIISATDPVAVLALFKEFGVPKRLTMIFEGESLINDGMAMALFLVLLSVAVDGFHGFETILHGSIDLVLMISLGVLFGLIVATIFSRFLRLTKSNEFVTVTLLLISAHIVFILTEAINETGIIHVSSIIATTVAGLFLGNYSRHLLEPHVDSYLTKLIEHMAFVVNSLVFIMAGLLFASSGIDIRDLWLPILITVLIVALARAVSIYSVIIPLNFAKLEAHIPSSWQKLLAWGSIRGALSIIIVTLIPANFAPDGWSYSHSPRELLLTLTIGCILATLFIKVPFIKPLVKKYHIDDPEPLEKAHEIDLGLYYLMTELSRLVMHKLKGFVTAEDFERLKHQVKTKINRLEDERQALVEKHGRKLFDQSLHLAMIHAERTTLKRLYVNHEVSERTYRKLHGKLTLQTEKIEYAQHEEIDPSLYTDRKDVFDRMMNFLQSIFERRANREDRLEEKLQYYRAQMIMARKAVQAITKMQNEHGATVFLQDSFESVVSRYERYREQAGQKVDELVATHPDELAPYLAALAQRSLNSSGKRALSQLEYNGLIDDHAEKVISLKFNP